MKNQLPEDFFLHVRRKRGGFRVEMADGSHAIQAVATASTLSEALLEMVEALNAVISSEPNPIFLTPGGNA